ncbi:serine/threonine-protein kinase [Novosphingobium bradum]|uniref:Serine/threonine-protein kinase n=1 Tax=Novosphingobium bradum TaxID=1737444 RepID=A0ABV7IQJ0_9SPHN
MNGDESGIGPDDEPESEETVFRPSALARSAGAVPGAADLPSVPEGAGKPGEAPDEGADDGATVFDPGHVAAPVAAPPMPAPPMAVPPPPPPAPAAGGARKGGRIEVGDRLNHMFEVTRFIARGGMGEVFEGKNIMSGEKVAIKVILPALAADPKVVAMFRKEAQALLRLQHEALVRYVVQAQEPDLGCEYIVTGFIDGTNLSDALGKITPEMSELVVLTRRIASGLKVAHDLGVVHRDISPDNILLEGDRLDRARVIDFGIVKDTNPDAHTIIDDGFAGKMRFVAPEQLGDFDAQVGNWSDVYSLALVIVALAAGKPADLGGLPGEAMKKRRTGVDTSAVPQPLRAVIDRMLEADPARRMRSMDAVIEALDRVKLAEGRGKNKAGGRAGGKPGGAGAGGDGAMAALLGNRKLLIGGGAAAAIVLVGVAGMIAFGGGKDGQPVAAEAPVAGAKAVAAGDLERAVQASLPAIPCSWVEVAVGQGGGGFSLTGQGVSSQPDKVESGIFDAVRKLGAQVTASDFAKVAPLDPSYCGMLDELRKIRDPGPARVIASQPRYELATMTEGDYAGKLGARVITDLSLDGIDGEFALYSIEKSNVVSQIVGSRAEFTQVAQNNPAITQIGKDRYRIAIDGEVQPGWSGMVLITGKGGFSADLLSGLATPAGQARFEQTARANGWKASIAWYKFVDDTPG